MPPAGPARGEAKEDNDGEDWYWWRAGLLLGVAGTMPVALGNVNWL